MRRRLDIARLADLVDRSRLSQNHWAIRLGLSRGHWSDLLKGRHPYPSARTRQRIAEVFGVDEDELFIAESQGTPDLDFRQAMFARFEITGELGSGGMGTVFRAFDRHLAREVALKMVSDEAASGVGSEQLLQEIRLVSRLQHPNILPLFEAGANEGRPWYTMPLVEGGSLGAILRGRTRLSLGETAQLVSAIARGLSHAHERGVLHCDVKPENILVHERAFRDGFGAEGVVKVTDFDLGRATSQMAAGSILYSQSMNSDAARDIAGTLDYMSPEQRSGGQLDGRSDLYACGVILYELLTGERPAGMDLPSDLNRSVPKALDEIFRRSYARLDKRFSSAGEFGDALKKLAAPSLAANEGPGAVAQAHLPMAKPFEPMRSPPDVLSRPAGHRQTFVACPQCRHSVDSTDQFCMHCGVQLVTSVRRCGKCGAYPDPSDHYCIFCGETLERRPASAGVA